MCSDCPPDHDVPDGAVSSAPDLGRRVALRMLLGAPAVLAGASLGLVSAGCTDEPSSDRLCKGDPGLPAPDQQVRLSVSYTRWSPHEYRNCRNCSLFRRAEDGGDCGGCQVLKGPIAAAGYCSSWKPAPGV